MFYTNKIVILTEIFLLELLLILFKDIEGSDILDSTNFVSSGQTDPEYL